MKIDLIPEQAERALRDCFEAVPFLRVVSIERQPPQNGKQADLLVSLELPNKKEKTVVVECKSSGEPRIAREAVDALMRSGAGNYGLFMAPYISPKAAEICAAANIGYVDLVGNCRVVFDNIYIEREGKSNPLRSKRKFRSLYSRKASRILRVLLSNPRAAWRLQSLADEAQTSLGLVSNVKKRLFDQEWAETTPKGLRLTEPQALLEDWSERYDFGKNKAQTSHSLEAVPKLESALADASATAGLDFALTSFSASMRYAPAVRYRRVSAFVSSAGQLAKLLDLKPVEQGFNLTLLTAYDKGVFYDCRDFEGVRVVSPVQAYLDVRSSRERGEEAAEALLEQTLRPSW